MEDKFKINVSDFSVGPDDLDRLLKEWPKDPKPKNINELARNLLTHRYETETGFLPYDSRNRYKEKDRIIVRHRALEGFFYYALAEVISIARNVHIDDEGFTRDNIDVRFLRIYNNSISPGPEFNLDKLHRFTANYQGNEYHALANCEPISDEDKTNIIPKLLSELSNDNRFVDFQGNWLPSELLINDLSTKLNDVRRIIAKCKHSLSTGEILEKIDTEDNAEELGDRLEFSLNYFLECDKRFIRISDVDTKWDLRKPSDSVRVTINERILSTRKLRISSGLELLLFYHGFVSQCAFSFPYNRKITAYHDISEGAICGEEFVNELTKLSENKEYKVRFGHPEHRGGPICVSAPDEAEKIQSTVTIRQEWLAAGLLKVPKRLSSYMKGTNTVHVLYDQIEEELPYEEGDRFIEELHEFYSKKAIDAFDRVQLQLESLGPTRLFIHSSWNVSLNKLLEIEPQDLKWERSSLRDCIIVVLAKFRTPAHYREIYTEIAIHKNVSLGSIIGTLSRYCPSVFVHVGWGKWGLAGWAEQEGRPKPEATEREKIIEISNEVWKAVAIIEENDYVYKLLEEIRKPLIFDEICNWLADYLQVDVQGLRATGFLRADDKRLRKLDDGSWALEEWFARDDGQAVSVEDSGEEIKVEAIIPKDSSKRSRSWLLLVALLILLSASIVVGGILIWMFLYRR